MDSGAKCFRLFVTVSEIEKKKNWSKEMRKIQTLGLYVFLS